MSFKAYKAGRMTGDVWRLDDGVPVRFSGPSGLVALWVRANREAADRPWKVGPFEWLQLMLPEADAAARWIVFEQEEDGRRVLSRLILVSGVAARQVEMMFTFAPLEVVHAGPGIRIRASDHSRLWSEELALEGGPYASQCSWRWTRPHLALGAALLRPGPTAMVGRAG